MGLIQCPECEGSLSEQAEVCPHCGYPIKKIAAEQAEIRKRNAATFVEDVNATTNTFTNAQTTNSQPQNQGRPQQTRSTQTVVQPYNKQQGKFKLPMSGMSIAAMVLSLLGPLAVIAVILAIVDLAMNDTNKRHSLSIVAICISALIFIAFLSGGSNGNSTSNGPSTTVVTPEPSKIENTNPKTETANRKVKNTPPKAIEEPSMTKEQFIASCKDIDYKEMARNPEKFIGQNFKFRAYVFSAREGGFLIGYQKYYISYAYDQKKVDEMVKKGYLDSAKDDAAKFYGWDTDTCVWLLDNRDTNSKDYIKILEEDIVDVYGTFNGLQESSNALTGEKGEQVALDIKYVELIAE